jgi:spore coat polysaccharide biosynthesis protein SpsF
MDWKGFSGEARIGWEWVVLRREFAGRPPEVHPPIPRVLVTMGGSDPAGITFKAVSALDLLEGDFETVVVAGQGFAGDAALDGLQSGGGRKFRVLRDVADMAGVMAGADLAVASFGVTAYELAALGVPAVYLCLTEDHAISAGMFDEEGLGVNLGLYSAVSPGSIADAVRKLLADPARRETMARAGRSRVDGKGARRIADLIAARCGSVT